MTRYFKRLEISDYFKRGEIYKADKDGYILGDNSDKMGLWQEWGEVTEGQYNAQEANSDG